MDGLIGISAMSRGCADDGSDSSKQVGAPVRSKATSHLAVCGGWPQFPFAAVVIGWCVGMIQECEQVAAVPAVTFSQALAMLIDWSECHDGIQVTVQSPLIGATRAFGQFLAPSRQHDRAQQQRLHARSEDLVARFAGVLAVAQLVRQTDLPEIGVSLLGTVEVGHPYAGPMAIEHIGHDAGSAAVADDVNDRLLVLEHPVPVSATA